MLDPVGTRLPAVVDFGSMSSSANLRQTILGEPPLTPARALIPAAVLAALEGLFGLGFAVYAATDFHPDRAVVTVGTVVTMVVYAVALLAAARAVWRQRGWARAVVVAANLLHLPIAWSFVSGAGQGAEWGPVAAGVALGVVSIVVLVCMFWPSSIRAFANPNGPAGQH